MQVELNNGLYAFTENIQRHIFIGRVDGVGFEPEAHQNGFNAQHLLEGGNDGNAAAPAYCQRFLSECLFKPFFGGLIGRQGDGAYIPLSAVHRSDLYLH